MKRFPGLHPSVAAIAVGLALAALPAPGSAGTAREQALQEASQPGAFCTSFRCRPRAASAWTGASFGAVVLAIGWQARRRKHPER